MNEKLWFFWGQPTMTYLRYMTLLTATLIHKDVVLIVRKNPIIPKGRWAEEQDWQHLNKNDWMPEAKKLPTEIIELENFSPEIAKLSASDIHTSDLLSWFILANHGGTVADMDIVFINSVPAIEADTQFVRFKGYPKAGYVPVSFLQGRPCQTWKEVYQKALKSYDPKVYESCGSAMLDGVVPDLQLPDSVVFPWAGRYPWHRWHRWMFQLYGWPDVPKESIGVHWYAGHNQKYNQLPELPKTGLIPHLIRKVTKHESLSS